MRTQSFDTDEATENIQISLLRKASVAQKITNVFSLSQFIIQLSYRAIARANPVMSKDELNLLFVSYCYGTKLAEHLKNTLKSKKDENTFDSPGRWI